MERRQRLGHEAQCSAAVTQLPGRCQACFEEAPFEKLGEQWEEKQPHGSKVKTGDGCEPETRAAPSSAL